MESIFRYFLKKISGCFGLFWFVSFYFGLFRNSLFWFFRFYTETESFYVSTEPIQTEDQPKQFDREHILVFFWKFRVVSICFGLFWNSSVCFGCFDIGSKHRNKPKQTETNRNFLFLVSRNQLKHNRNLSCFGLFQFKPKTFFVSFEDTPVCSDLPKQIFWNLYILQISTV